MLRQHSCALNDLPPVKSDLIDDPIGMQAPTEAMDEVEKPESNHLRDQAGKLISAEANGDSFDLTVLVAIISSGITTMAWPVDWRLCHRLN